jgi:hypothetical protein
MHEAHCPALQADWTGACAEIPEVWLQQHADADRAGPSVCMQVLQKGQTAVQAIVPDAVQAQWRKLLGSKKGNDDSELEVDDSLDDADGASSVGDADRDVGDDEHLLYWEVRQIWLPFFPFPALPWPVVPSPWSTRCTGRCQTWLPSQALGSPQSCPLDESLPSPHAVLLPGSCCIWILLLCS